MTDREHFSPRFAARMETEYGPEIISQLDSWQKAPLLHAPGEYINYVTVGDESNAERRRRILFIGGHLGGIIAGSLLGAEMAKLGYQVTIPDQHRGKMARQGLLVNPTYTQALNVAAVAESANLQNEPLDIITHSYGSLILSSLGKIVMARRWNMLSGARVAMLAPAGMKHDETIRSFLHRYNSRNDAGAQRFEPDSWYEFTSEINQPGNVFSQQSLLRDKWEGLQIAYKRVDIKSLFESGVAKIGAFLHSDDRIYPPELFASTIAQNSFNNLTFAVVYAQSPGQYEVSHSDQQIQPANDAHVIDNFFSGS